MAVVELVEPVAAEHQVAGALDDAEHVDLDGRAVVLPGTEVDVPVLGVGTEREHRLDRDDDLDEALDLPRDEDPDEEVLRRDLDHRQDAHRHARARRRSEAAT